MLDAVLDSSEEFSSDDKCCGESSMDESSSEDEEDAPLLRFISEDSLKDNVLVDVSSIFLLLFTHSYIDQMPNY